MIFWFGGILGALLVAVGLFMLIQRSRAAGWVLLAGLVLGGLLVPALGLYRETQAYLITGLVGVGLLVLGVVFASRLRRFGPALVGLGLVLATFLLPHFRLTQPWNTNPMALISGNPASGPVTGIQPTEPAPLTPPADPNSPAPATDPSAPADPTTPALPEQSTLPTDPASPPPAQPAQPPATGDTGLAQPVQPGDTSTVAPAQPVAPSAPNQPVGAVESNQLCPCVVRVSTGISDATVVLSKDGRELSRQTGAQVVFSNLEMGAYSLSVGALGHQTFTTPLQVSNNKDLTVYLLRQ